MWVSTIPSTFLCIVPKLISYIYFTNSSEESKNKVTAVDSRLSVFICIICIISVKQCQIAKLLPWNICSVLRRDIFLYQTGVI